MLRPSIFGESLFDEFFDFPEFPDFSELEKMENKMDFLSRERQKAS